MKEKQKDFYFYVEVLILLDNHRDENIKQVDAFLFYTHTNKGRVMKQIGENQVLILFK